MTKNEYFFMMLTYALIWGFLCALVARNKNLNDVAWFFAGLFFGVFTLILLLTEPAKKILPATQPIRQTQVPITLAQYKESIRQI